jgi:hypothetical protein
MPVRFQEAEKLRVRDGVRPQLWLFRSTIKDVASYVGCVRVTRYNRNWSLEEMDFFVAWTGGARNIALLQAGQADAFPKAWR